MLKVKYKLIGTMLGFLGLMLAPSLAYAGTANFTFSPTTITVNPSQTFDVSVKVKLTDQQANTFNLEVYYPSSLMTYNSYTVANGSKCTWPIESKGAGRFEIALGCAATYLSQSDGDYVLATIRFTSLGGSGGKGDVVFGSKTRAINVGADVASTKSSIVTVTVGGNTTVVPTPVTGGGTSGGSTGTTSTGSTSGGGSSKNEEGNDQGTNDTSSTPSGGQSGSNTDLSQVSVTNDGVQNTKTTAKTPIQKIVASNLVNTLVLNYKKYLIPIVVGLVLAVLLIGFLFVHLLKVLYSKKKKVDAEKVTPAMPIDNTSGFVTNTTPTNTSTNLSNPDSIKIDTMADINGKPRPQEPNEVHIAEIDAAEAALSSASVEPTTMPAQPQPQPEPNATDTPSPSVENYQTQDVPVETPPTIVDPPILPDRDSEAPVPQNDTPQQNT